MSELIIVILIYGIGINIYGFFAMYQDKQFARKQKRRIPEKRLIRIALVGGSLGSFLAMRVCRHKTKHPTFAVGLPCILLLHSGILLFILFYIQA